MNKGIYIFCHICDHQCVLYLVLLYGDTYGGGQLSQFTHRDNYIH